jgi:hypothetical protein
MSNAVARKEDWGQLGPCMKTLPNDQWRAFAEAYATKKPGHGMLVEAAREAGFGVGSTPEIQAKIAWRLANDDRMIAAIAELSRKIIRVGAPEAANAALALVRNPEHKDHGRAIQWFLDRADPIETKHRMEVVHRNIDPDEEAIEELKALRALGTPREKLLELYGHNGLERLEDLASSRAKVIEHEPAESPPASRNRVATILAPASKKRTSARPAKMEPAVPDELLDQGDDF